MTDPTAPTPQDADTTQAVPTGTTEHLPTQGTGSAAWTTWVPAAEQRPPSAPSTWSPPHGGGTAVITFPMTFSGTERVQ